MSDTYFSLDRSANHMFYIEGDRGDDHFTDHGFRHINNEWLLYYELKRVGYERIYFYNPDNMLYCYDDDSYRLRSATVREELPAQPAPQKRRRYPGLKRGTFKTTVISQSEQPDNNNPVMQPPTVQNEQTEWHTDEKSGLAFRSVSSEVLHLGRNQNHNAVVNMIFGWLNNSIYRTAVVVCDPQLCLEIHDRIYRIGHGVNRWYVDNENILVFFLDKNSMNRIAGTNEESRKAFKENSAIIRMKCPNVLEIRNMLQWFSYRSTKPLRFAFKDLDSISDKIYRSFQTLDESEKRLNVLFRKVDAFRQRENAVLTVENCQEVLQLPAVKTAIEELERMVGMKKLKEELYSYQDSQYNFEKRRQKMRASVLQPDNSNGNNEMIHIVLTGNPGTGKTTVANLLGRFFYELGYLETGNVVSVSRSDLVSQHIGETAIKTGEVVKSALGGVLFIDEAYSLRMNNNDTTDFGLEAINALVDCMTRYKGKFILVAAGYKHQMNNFLEGNPGLKSRFTKYIDIPDYTPSEMQQILEMKVQNLGYRFSADFQKLLPDFCENWVRLTGVKHVEVGIGDWLSELENAWGNAREAENLSNAIVRERKNDPSPDVKVLEPRHLPEAYRVFLTPVEDMKQQVINNLEGLTGLTGVKTSIKNKLTHLNVRLPGESGVNPGHYLFVGNPGTGKTTVARLFGALLRNIGVLKRGHILECSPQSLMAQLNNHDYRIQGNIENVFLKALDGVLFIDEAYQLVTTSDARGREILDTLLSFMENHRDNLCVICAGYENEIDELLRFNPGFPDRFSDRILFENYTGAELYAILQKMYTEIHMEMSDSFATQMQQSLYHYVKRHESDKKFSNARFLRKEVYDRSLVKYKTRIAKQTDGQTSALLEPEDMPEILAAMSKMPIPKPDTRTAMQMMQDMIGYDKIKKELQQLLAKAKSRNDTRFQGEYMPERLHWVIEGNPGTGKTTIVNLIAKVYKEAGLLPSDVVITAKKCDLVADHVGGTSIMTNRVIEHAMGHVLFVDEAYDLTEQEHGDNAKSFGSEAVAAFVSQMELHNGEFAVIFAGYPAQMERFLSSNSGLASRVKKFVLDDYSPAELKKIFLGKCKKQQCRISPALDERLELLFGNMKKTESKLRDWGNGREAENLLRNMISIWHTMDENGNTQPTQQDENGILYRILDINHIPADYVHYSKGELSEKKVPKTAMEMINELVGFDELKEYLQGLLDLGSIADTEPDLLDGINLHMLLKGNPGTGKSMAAKLIGKVYQQVGLLKRGHTVKVTRDDLVAGYMGQTATKTKEKIKEAIGGVLFIDEAYALVSEKGGVDSYGMEALNTILEAMTDLNGQFAVIAAGYPREMDNFLRANSGLKSRFGRTFMLSDYSSAELKQIFAMKCKERSFTVGEDLNEKLEALFARWRMIESPWANGRQAENLEIEMRPIWVRDRIMAQQKGQNTGRVYHLNHLPEKYRLLLQNGNAKKSDSEKPAQKAKLALPESALLPKPEPDFEFSVEKSLEKVLGLVFIAHEGGSGSGSIISKDGYVLTCCHVVREAKNLRVKLCLDATDFTKVEWKNAQVVWLDSGLDMAILKLEPGEYTAIPLQPQGETVMPGENVFHWGYPFGKKIADSETALNPSTFNGSIASIQSKDGYDRLYANLEAKAGCSGGPVFSKKTGNIIGILCGSTLEAGDKLTEELNFARPVQYVWSDIFESANRQQEDNAENSNGRMISSQEENDDE